MERIVFNTGETPDELRESYNPEGSSLRKAQLRMLDMLLYLDRVCKEQNIPYRIDGGNVLGAIRHGGFIPWDDDIDIVLLRKDQKKLCRYLKKHPHPQYKLQSFSTDYGFVGAWSVLRDTKSEYIKENDNVHNVRKYRGLQVDIFPYENRIIWPFFRFTRYITHLNHKLFITKWNCLLLARFVYIIQFGILHPFFRLAGFLFGDPKVYMHAYGATFTMRHFANSLFPLKPLSFEGHEFPGPAVPIQYCLEYYGENYVNLPEKDKRNHHKAICTIQD